MFVENVEFIKQITGKDCFCISMINALRCIKGRIKNFEKLENALKDLMPHGVSVEGWNFLKDYYNGTEKLSEKYIFNWPKYIRDCNIELSFVEPYDIHTIERIKNDNGVIIIGVPVREKFHCVLITEVDEHALRGFEPFEKDIALPYVKYSRNLTVGLNIEIRRQEFENGGSDYTLPACWKPAIYFDYSKIL
jgi:hypothetical protein